MPEVSKLHILTHPEFWVEFLNEREDKSIGFRRKIDAYREAVESRAILRAVDEILDGTHQFHPPTRHFINKITTSKKKIVYTFSPLDELLLKGVNVVLQDLLEPCISPVCHSFRKGRGAKSAFRSIFADRDIDSKFCLRLDIKNYFNSVNIGNFLARLPDEVTDDHLLFHLLKSVLEDNRVLWNGGITTDELKGLMAGTPLAPILSNVYLYSLDELLRGKNITYVRYSDDIILFVEESKFHDAKESVYSFLNECHLQVNESKTSVIPPGEPWEYLGFRYNRGIVDISEVTLAKAKGKIRRLANRYNNFRKWKSADPGDACARFVRRINRKYFGGFDDDGDLCWAQWFFPIITTSDSLKELDSYIQDKIRFVASGHYSFRSHKVMPYSKMTELGYMPLTTAYYAYRKEPEEYFSYIQSRILREEEK
jgi:RNA-directed DNA polymerase